MTLNTDFRQPLQSLRRSARSFGRSPRRVRPLDRVVDAIDRLAPPKDHEWVRMREWMVPSKRSASTLARTVGVGAATTAALVAYSQFVRPWQRTWGASDAETKRTLPGDDLLSNPTYATTRAITIKADPDVIWPVLLELGHWRGHLYAEEDLTASLGTSGDGARIEEAQFRHLEREDAVGFGPAPWVGRWNRMRVVEMIPRRALVFGSMDETLVSDNEADARLGTWAFILSPIKPGMTRLLVRTRSRPSWALRPAVEAYDPVAFLAERNLLLTIQHVAETKRPEDSERVRMPA